MDKDKLHILMVASEGMPFFKTGGLGDVVGALPKALARRGHEVVVCLPRYGFFDGVKYGLQKADFGVSVAINGREHAARFEVVRDRRLPLTIYFIDNEFYFGRGSLYTDTETGRDYTDNDERFMFFCRAALEAVRKQGWMPDLVHVHDWQTALIPALLKHVYNDDSFFANVKSVLTIHNLSYQGIFPADRFGTLGLPESLFYATGPFEFFGKVNFLKGGIVCADKITTVSQTYAREITRSSEMGCGLEGVLSDRDKDLSGILNGVDYTVWSPSRDKYIPFRFHLPNLGGKKKTKIELVNRAGIPVRDRTPLIGVISRLVDQKGFDLMADAADRMFQRDVQMIVLGTGDPRYHELFTSLQEKYPDKLRVFLKFDEELAHWIEAGSDVFLMPSRFEPCGLNQMYSLRYGTVPIVHRVGGLADTVVDYDPETGAGTGFVFEEYTAEALLASLDRAIELFARKRLWTKLLKAGMKQDFSWDKAAETYDELFTSTIRG